MESNSKESSIIGLMDLTKINGNNSCEEDKNKHPLMEFSTKAIHTHLRKDQWDVSTSVAPPITLSATYLMKTPEEIPGEWLYGRYGNPSRDQVELTLAAIEGDAKHALCFSSGMAAANAMLEATLGHNSVSGDHVVAIRQVYGGIFNLLKTGLGYGHSTKFVSGMDMVELREALKPNTKMFWMEVASNPLIRIFDLKKIIGVVKSYNKDIIIVVDNTMLSPYIVRPLEFGADVVFHSCTKYLGGHSDIILGCLVTNQESIYQNLKQVQRCRGATPSAFDCYLLARSLQTLEIRMKRHHETGLKVAHFLSNHKYVEDVMHPLLGSHPDQALTMTQNSGLHSGMVSFKFKGGKSEAAKFLDYMKVISHAASFGGAHSLACLPASITHIFLTAQEKEEAGITDSLIRVSVGLENSRDLITDLDQALKKAKA